MTRFCFLYKEFKIAEIRDGVLWNILDFSWFYEHRLWLPDMEWVRDIEEMKEKYLFVTIGDLKC